MLLKDARGFQEYFTGKASDVARQLAFAGIATIWLLRVGEKTGGIPFSGALLWPLLLFVAALASDLLQYVYAGTAWSIFHRTKEKELKPEELGTKEFLAPREINWPTNFFYYLKLVLTVCAFFPLLTYIYSRI